MAAFTYVALSRDGKQKKGVRDADSARAVRQMLREQSLMPMEVAPAAHSESRNEVSSGFSFGRPSLKVADLALITRQLATLVQAGIPLEEALGTVAKQSDKARINGILMAVRAKVLEGYTLADALAAHSILTVGDLLDLPPEALGVDGVISPAEQEQVHTALSRALDDGLRQFDSAAANDWPTLRAQLLGPLDDTGRKLLIAAIGLDEPVQPRQALLQVLGAAHLDDSLDHIRTTLMQCGTGLMRRIEQEIDREFDAFDGVLHAPHAGLGSGISIITKATGDPELGLRLVAFCLPHRCHLHRGFLHGVTPRRFRELLRTLPQLVPQHRLPMAVDEIMSRLADRNAEVPRGVLLHVLRSELRTAIELDGDTGEVAVPDPLTPAARLIEILEDTGEAASLPDLVFAYRERFRFASGQRLMRHLSSNSAFLRIGVDLWALRQWHEQELQDCAELVENIARRISIAESRQKRTATRGGRVGRAHLMARAGPAPSRPTRPHARPRRSLRR